MPTDTLPADLDDPGSVLADTTGDITLTPGEAANVARLLATDPEPTTALVELLRRPPTTPLDLHTLHAAEAAMTPRPWRAEMTTDTFGHLGAIVLPDGRTVAIDCDPADLAGIVAMRNAAPALLAEIARLRSWLHGLHDAATDLCAGWPEGGCVATPPCKACRWCVFETATETIREEMHAANG
jgi:hypothetical protein